MVKEHAFIVDIKGTAVVRTEAKNRKGALKQIESLPAEEIEIDDYTAVYDINSGKLIKKL